VLRAWLKDFDPDVIHHHDGILWPRVATSRLAIPLMTHGHLGRPAAGPLSSAYWTHRFVAAHTDRLIAISDWVAASWRKGGFPASRIRTIPNGVDTERYFVRDEREKEKLRKQLGLPTDRTVVLWVGRLDRGTKGLDRLIAFAALNRDAQIVVVGDGPDRDWLRLEIDKLTKERRPVLVGKVADPSSYFGAADTFLFTSRVESFGLVLLEAAACGLPILAFPCDGGGVDLLNRCKATMIPQALTAATLERILEGRRDDRELRLIAADVSENYSWQATASTIEGAYRELLGSVSAAVCENARR
jgi:glycosyltransferase involved in cell wall biosynthesis